MLLSRSVTAIYRYGLYMRCVSGTTKIIIKEDLPAVAYRPEIVEKNKYAAWEKEGLFRPDNACEKPNFSMVLPPPNVTGKLHLGHALACTIQDVIVRRKRAAGHNVLWLPGTDHAGIATQTVVERHLKSQHNINRMDLTREKFNNEVLKWKEKYGHIITQQLRTLGCSLDWSREIFTMDAKHTHAVEEAFINLFRKSLIYRKKALVNWCNALKSTVSDIEIDNITVKGPTSIKISGYENAVKFGVMYDFAYKVFDSTDEIVVSTTMPETMLGDVAIAVHPEDTRYQHLKDKRAIHPFRNTAIPIIFDDFVDMKFGTGAVKITPAHSKIDYKIAKKHHLPLHQVINEEGLMVNSFKFNGKKRYECRELILQNLKYAGLLREVRSHEVTLPICSRTGDVIEYLPKEQWFISCKKMNERTIKLIEEGKLDIVPNKFLKNWVNWTADDRDWCISRQLWWGHRIPAYKCNVGQDIIWVAAKNEEEAKVEASKYLRSLPDEITSVRDEDVLDTWFSSGIYPFAALGWPEHCHNDDFLKFYPLSLMATGHDILGFWVHRMVMLGLELTDKLPFKKVLLHGIICDKKGAKMSKSKGNVIDPIDIINGISLDVLKEKMQNMNKEGVLSKEELNKALTYQKNNFSNNNGIPECGVDALRFTLLCHDIKSHFVNFDLDICHSNMLFCNKIWQSIKYMHLSCAKLEKIDDKISLDDLSNFDIWILSKLANMIEIVNVAMDNYEFHVATKALRRHIYNEFCDIYLEATKPGFDETACKRGYAHVHTLSAVLNASLRCLAPFMIYLTEELIPKIPVVQSNIIYNFDDHENKIYDFPKVKDFKKWKNNETETRIDKILHAVNLIREIKGFYSIPNRIKPTFFIETNDSRLISNVNENYDVVLHLTRCSGIETEQNKSLKYVTAILDNDTKVLVNVTGLDDKVLAARAKLEKRINKLQITLSKLEVKYSSEVYLTNVPEWVRAVDKEKFAVKKEELNLLQRLM